jgi:hypothetical protein
MTTDERALAVASQAVIERANLRTSCLQSEICVSGPCACADDIAGAVIKAYLAALTAAQAADGYQLVPTSALQWLAGMAPDANGVWFGDGEYARQGRGAYWWRTRFAAMCAAPPVIAEEREGSND